MHRIFVDPYFFRACSPCSAVHPQRHNGAIRPPPPWCSPVSAIIEVNSQRHHTPQECLLLCFGVMQILLNELIIKRIVAKPRPLGSCNISCGMPSSHATVAAGYCVWLILEVIYANWLMERQRYSDSYADDEQFGPRADEEACLPNEALTLWGQWCSVRKARWIVALLLICVPIPPCRVALHDHSGAQVIVGIVIGVLEGVAWWYVVQTYILPRLPPRGQFWCGCIEVPRPLSRCVFLPFNEP